MIRPGRHGWRTLAGWMLVAGLLAACDVGTAPAPTATFEWPTLAATVAPSPTVAPVLPEGDGQAGLSIGASNPTQAALAAEGQPSVEPPTPTLAPTQEILPMAITAPDGTTLQARYHAAVARPAPGILLIHQAGGSQADWEPLVEALHAAGYAILTFDLRGHGASGGQADWAQMPGDTQAALRLLSELPGVDASRIVTGGASIGANLALNACADFAGCAATILLSPGLDYHGITTAPAIPRLGGRPLLIVSSQNDGNNPGDSIMLDERAAAGDHTLVIVPAGGHGAALLAAEPGLVARIVGWLAARVPAPGQALTPLPGGS
mgnify:CR=1 FL=1